MFQQLIAQSLPYMPKALVGSVAKRYIAGETLEDAQRVVRRLAADGFMATVDVLGEDVTSGEDADRSVAEYEALIRVVADWHDAHEEPSISLKPTQFGLRFEPEGALERLTYLATLCDKHGVFLRLDMEDSSTTDDIIHLYRKLRTSRPGRVGCVFQAMLFRTQLDIQALAGETDHDIRLCKGIYREAPEIAWQDYQGLRDNFLHTSRMLLKSGTRSRLATHDPFLLENLQQMTAELGLPAEKIEFQALLGVPIMETLRKLKTLGHPVRIYVPYGQAWYSYSLRRLRENPAIVGNVMRGLLGPRR